VILVTVRNPNDTAERYPVRLELFGDVVNSQVVTVPAGGETTVRFVHDIVAPGNYTARVDSETATVRVLAPDESRPASPSAGESTTSTQFPGFGPPAVFVALAFVVVVLLRVRRIRP
jgi:hypothetical protein